MGGGGEEATTSVNAPAAAYGWGGTLQKSKSSAASTLTVASISTGPGVMGQPTHKNNNKVGVPSMTTMMMMMTAKTTTTGGAAKMPDGVGD
jgi:hypothetical protein